MDRKVVIFSNEAHRVLGEFQGTLQAILYWDIPPELKVFIEKKLAELKEFNYTNIYE